MLSHMKINKKCTKIDMRNGTCHEDCTQVLSGLIHLLLLATELVLKTGVQYVTLL